MIAISQWANRNPVKSRFLIASFHLLAVANAIILGLLFFLSDWPASSLLAFLLVNVFFVAYLRYPTNRRRLSKKKYWQQKRIDFTLALCYSLLIAVSLNNFLANEEGLPDGETDLTEVTIMHSALSAPPVATTNATLTKTERREARRSQFKALKSQFKELKTELRAWKKEHKGQKKGRGLANALLILLVLLGAAALAFGVAGLSCSLSCNGQEGMAVIVLLGGLTGIIWLSVVLIKSIYNREKPIPARPVHAK